MSSIDAELDGSDILKRYRDEKSILGEESFNLDNNMKTSSEVGDEDIEYFNGVAEGSKIGLLYSASKRGETSGNFSNSFSDDLEVIDIVRLAISKLSKIESDDNAKSVDYVSSLLQAVEEKLETETIDKQMGDYYSPVKSAQKHIVFTPTNDDRLQFSENSRVEDSQIFNRSLHSAQKSVIKVYMNNQLDLDQAELDKYEQYVNDLLSKVEHLESQNEDFKQLLHESTVEKEKLENENQSLKIEVNILHTDLGDSQKEIELISDELEELRSKNNLMKSINNSSSSELSRYESLVSNLRSQVQNLTTSQQELLHLTDLLNDEKKNLEESLRNTDSTLFLQKEQIDDLTTEIYNLKNVINSNENQTNELINLLNDKSSANSIKSPDFGLSIGSLVDNSGKESNNEEFSFKPDVDDSSLVSSEVIKNLQALLDQKEQQIRFQISQLESLQDSLSELKSANSVLIEQKRSLKQLKEETDKELQKYMSENSSNLNEISLLRQSIEILITEKNNNEKLIEDKEKLIDELNEEIISINKKNDHSNVYETPSKLNSSVYMTTPSSTNKRIQRLEQRIEDLLNEIFEHSAQKDNLTLELETAKLNLQNKIEKINELNNEIAKLKDENASKNDSTSNYNRADQLNSQLLSEHDKIKNNLVQELRLVNDKNKRLLNELNDLQKSNDSYQEYIKKLEEISYANEDMIQILKLDRETLKNEIEKQKNLFITNDKTEKNILVIKINDLTNTNSKLIEQINKLEKANLDFESSIKSKNSIISKYDSELKSTQNNVFILQNYNNRILQDIKFYKDNLEKEFQLLNDHISSLSVKYTDKIDSLQDQLTSVLQYYFTSYSSNKNKFIRLNIDEFLSWSQTKFNTLSRSDLLDIIKVYQDELINSRDLSNDYALENQNLVQEINDLTERHNETYLESHSIISKGSEELSLLLSSNLLKNSLQIIDSSHMNIPIEEFENLKSKIYSLEIENENLSKDAATSYATTTNRIALLESEKSHLINENLNFKQDNARLKSTIDTLSHDITKLKSAYESEIHLNNLKYGQISEQLNIVVSDKGKLENELIELFQNNQLLQQQVFRLNEVEIEYRSLIGKYDSLINENQLLELSKNEIDIKFENLYENSLNERKRYEHSINDLNDEINRLTKSFSELIDSSSNLRNLLHAEQDKVNALESSLKVSQLNYENYVFDSKNQINNLNSDIEKCKDQINKNELIINNLNSVIGDLEYDIETKNNLVSNLENKLVVLNEEISLLKNQNFQFAKENAYFKDENKNLSNQLSDKNEDVTNIRNQYDELKSKSFKLLQRKLDDTEKDYRSLSTEYENLKLLYSNLEIKFSNIKLNHDDLENKYAAMQLQKNQLESNLSNVETNFSITSENLNEMKKNLALVENNKIIVDDLLIQKEDELKRCINKLKNFEYGMNVLENNVKVLSELNSSYIDIMKGIKKSILSSKSKINDYISEFYKNVNFKSNKIDLFSSPDPKSNLSNIELNVSIHSVNSTTQNLVYDVRDNFVDLMQNISDYLNQNKNLLDVIEKQRQDILDRDVKIENLVNENIVLKEDLDIINKDKETLEDNIQHLSGHNLQLTSDNTENKSIIESISRHLHSLEQDILTNFYDIKNRILTKLSENHLQKEYNNQYVELKDLALSIIENIDETTNISIINPIRLRIKDMDNLLNMTSDLSVGLMNELHNKNLLIDKYIKNEKKLNLQLEAEIAEYVAKLTSLENNSKFNQINSEKLVDKLHNKETEIGELKNQLYNYQNESNNYLLLNQDLTDNLNKSEDIITELNKKNLNIQNEIDNLNVDISNKQKEITDKSTELSKYQTIIKDNELRIDRLERDQNDLIDKIENLSTEIENINKENEFKILQLSNNNIYDIKRYEFEIEKLIVICKSISNLFNSTKHIDDNGIESNIENQSDLSASLLDRIKNTINQLNVLFNVLHNNDKDKKQLLTNYNELNNNYNQLKILFDEQTRKSNEYHNFLNDKDTLLQDISNTNSIYNKQLNYIKNDNEKLSNEITNLSLLLDNERKQRQQFYQELQIKGNSIDILQNELDTLKSQYSLLIIEKNDLQIINDKLANKNNIYHDNIKNLKNDLSTTKNELNNSNISNNQLRNQLNNIDLTHKDKFEKLNTEIEKLTNYVIENDKNIHTLQNQNNQLLYENNEISETIKNYSNSINDLTKQLKLRESNIQSLTSELNELINSKNNLINTNNELLNELNKTKLLLSDNKIIETNKNEKLIELLNNLQNKLVKLENDKKNLVNINNTLNNNIQTINNKINIENEKNNLLNIDNKKLVNQIKFLNEQNLLFKNEGKKTKKNIVVLVGKIREIINIIRNDLNKNNVIIDSPSKNSTNQITILSENNYEEISIIESLGINDLVNAIESFDEILIYIRQYISINNPNNSNSSSNNESIIKKLKNENNRLMNKINELQSDIKQIQSLENALQNPPISTLLVNNVSQYTQSNTQQYRSQIDILENQLKIEKDNKVNILNEHRQLKSKFDNLENDYNLLKKLQQQKLIDNNQNNSDVSSLQYSLQKVKSELESTKEDNHHLRLEVKSVNHHRSVLRDAVESLEKQLKYKIDSIVNNYLSNNQSHSNNNEEVEILNKKLLRCKAKSQSLEDLISVYRTSLFALYPDGSSYSAAQYNDLLSIYKSYSNDRKLDNSFSLNVSIYWIEKEIKDIRKGYEEEIKLMENELVEVRSKLRTQKIYIDELRTKYEENVRSIYRSSSFSSTATNEDITDHLNFLTNSLKTLQLNNEQLESKLAIDNSSQRRHLHILVDDITNSLQMRDIAIQSIRQLERYCNENGINVDAIIKNLENEFSRYKIFISLNETSENFLQQQRTIDSLVKGLVEADNEVQESNRREIRRKKSSSIDYKPSSGNPSVRSSSPPFVVRHTEDDITSKPPKPATSPMKINSSSSNTRITTPSSSIRSISSSNRPRTTSNDRLNTSYSLSTVTSTRRSHK